jgi:hypothetical protein
MGFSSLRQPARLLAAFVTRSRFRTATVIGLTGTFLLAATGTQAFAAETSPAAPPASGTGFSVPFSGPARYEYLAPTELTSSRQLNQPLGQRQAGYIARHLGLRKSDAFTRRQYLEFISGGGAGGSKPAAATIDASIRILTNTNGRPLYSWVDGKLTPSVLASYGLMVNLQGQLESPANQDAPTRKINNLLDPRGGYLNTWARANGATRSLIALYRSPYVVEAAYGYAAQHRSEPAQLVTNTKKGVSVEVGMSMAPALWLVNFILLYILNPSLAAAMPAHWAPIPAHVARAILYSPNGQVPYGRYQNDFG